MTPTLLMIPKPNPYPLVRLGGDSDGSYLLPMDLQDIDACISPGVNSYKYFEDDLAKFGIKSYMCDYSVDVEDLSTPLIEGMQVFEKKWLDIFGNQNDISLQELITKYIPDESKDLILQMDIEGAEYRNILHTIQSTMNRFRIIIVEVHYIRDGDLWTTPLMILPEKVSDLFKSFLLKMDETHICVHAHPNNAGGEFLDKETGLNVPNIIELTYLRRDRFTGDPTSYYKPQLPHPLDVDNCKEYSPLIFNYKWRELSSKYTIPE